MELYISNLNRIPANVSRQAISAALNFLTGIDESCRPRNFSEVDSTLADSIELLHDEFTSNFRPTASPFSVEISCDNSFLLVMNGQDETVSCSLVCENDILAFLCSATVGGHAVKSTLFKTNLACPDNTDPLPQLLSWISLAEKLLQRVPLKVTYKFSPDFESSKSAARLS